MAGPIYYQTFHLITAQGKKEEDNRQNLKCLEKRLIKKGYEVLESVNFDAGIPASLIVGGKLGMKIKDNFYAILEETAPTLKYKSGTVHLRIK
jgi:hypothetical protein